MATIVFGLTTIATVNVVIDPFWRFDLITLPVLNKQRPEFSSSGRMGKAGVICRLQPAQVVMGTSRAEVGLDPKHPGWASEPGPVYNLGLSGIGLKELSLTFQHAINAAPLQRAVIGLDFMMFNANREATVFGTEVLDFDEADLVLSQSDSCWRTLLHNADKLLGARGLLFSFLTLWHQLTSADAADMSKAAAWLSLYDRDGFRSYFSVGFTALLDHYGTRWAFSEGQEKYYVSKIWRPPPNERYCFTGPGQPSTLDTFREMVRFARRSGVDVRFFLEPLHARMMLAIQDAGLWPQFEDWKRGLVDVLAEDAKQSGKPQFPLWDFSGFNSVTDEHIPDNDDRVARMRWYWEPSHYKKEAGDVILDRVLDYLAPYGVDPADFGLRLSSENIESWLVATRAAGRDYVREEPNEARFVQGIVDRALVGAAGSNCGYYMDQLRTASAALRRGDEEAAKAAIERAKAIDEGDRRRAAEIGVAYREHGFARALQTAEAGKELPRNLDGWVAYQRRGIERDAAGDHRGAAEDFAHAIRIGPANPALHYLRGVALMHAADPEQAATEFESGLKLDPHNTTLKSLLDQVHQAGAPKSIPTKSVVDGTPSTTPR